MSWFGSRPEAPRRYDVWVLSLALFGTAWCASAAEHSPVRILRSHVVDCDGASSNPAVAPCLEIEIAWTHGLAAGEKPLVERVRTGAGFIDELTQKFRVHAPVVFDAIGQYLGKWVTRKSRRREPARSGLDRLFHAGLILCHLLDDEVSLTVTIERRIAALGHAFYRETGRKIVVTSGSRSPEAQARAMYTKHILGERLTRLYRSDVAREVEKAFRVARSAGAKKDATILAGAAVIREQVQRGVYISKHLMDDAVDVRSRDLTRKQKQIFRRLARQHGFRVLLETTPPHFHLSLANPEA